MIQRKKRVWAGRGWKAREGISKGDPSKDLRSGKQDLIRFHERN